MPLPATPECAPSGQLPLENQYVVISLQASQPAALLMLNAGCRHPGA